MAIVIVSHPTLKFFERSKAKGLGPAVAARRERPATEAVGAGVVATVKVAPTAWLRRFSAECDLAAGGGGTR